MAIKISSTPVRITVELSGEIDHHNAAALRLETDEAIQKVLAPNVRLDFGEVTFMDSSGIGLVMGRYAKMKTIGGELVLRGANERLMRIFKMAGLERIVRIEETDEEEENEGERN